MRLSAVAVVEFGVKSDDGARFGFKLGKVGPGKFKFNVHALPVLVRLAATCTPIFGIELVKPGAESKNGLRTLKVPFRSAPIAMGRTGGGRFRPIMAAERFILTVSKYHSTPSPSQKMIVIGAAVRMLIERAVESTGKRVFVILHM